MHRLLACTALLCLGAAAPASPSPSPAPAAPKASVAVLYFDDLSNSPELAVLRKGLSQMLIADLVAAGGFTVVERARLQDVLDELKLGQSAKIDPTTANKIGKLIGARYLVVGSYLQLSGNMVLNAQVLEVETAANVHALKVVGKADDFLALEQKIAADFAPFLAKLVPPAPAKTGSLDSPAAKPKAAPSRLAVQTAVKYSKALDALDRKDAVAARAQLEAVVKDQPDFALAAQELAALMR